jgi:putative hydrolase of the HAD superfamily
MKYDAVLFDLFGTLVPPFPEFEFAESLRDMSQLLGVDPVRFHQAWAYETWEDHATGVFATVGANLQDICRTLNVPVTEEQLVRATACRLAFTRSVLHPRHDAISVLAELRSRQIPLGLVSDCSAEVPAMWPQLPFSPYFDKTVFSCVLGTKKPDPRMYQAAYEGMGIPPDRCLYVGDGFSEELSGAARLGLHAVLISEPADPANGGSVKGEAATWTGTRISSLTEILEITC